MARKPECNFTPCLNQFTTCIRGKRHRLGTNEKVARERFDWLMREDGQVETVKEANPLLGDLFTPWLHYVEKQHAPDRFRLCRDRLLDFLRFIGEGARIGDLRTNHVENWIASKRNLILDNEKKNTISPGTERNYKAIILACLNWCAKPVSLGGGELIPSNPLRSRLKLPEDGSRGSDAVWEPETFAQVCRVGNPAFVDAIRMLAWTGMRPSLLCRLEASHYNPQYKRFDVNEITHRRKKAVYVRLNQPAIELVEALKARHPIGKLFRNAHGEPWLDDALQLYLYQLMHKFQDTKTLDWQKGITVKGLRHTFATAYLRTHPNEIEYLRVLLGHKDYKMIFKHYGKLVDQNQSINERLSTFSPFPAI